MAVVNGEPKTGVSVRFSNASAAGRMSRLELNGQDISRFCTGFVLDASVNKMVTATIEVLPRDGFDVELDALTTVNVVAYPGYVLVEEVTATGRRWRVEPEKRG